MVFDNWNDDPFHLDLYENTFTLFFDIIILPVACIIVTIIFIAWIYLLFCASTKKKEKFSFKPSAPKDGTNLQWKGSMSSMDGSSHKNKPNVDLSLPTLTVQESKEPSKSIEISKTPPATPKDGDAVELEITPFGNDEQTQTNIDINAEKKRKKGHGQRIKKYQSIHTISKILSTLCIALACSFLYSITAFVILSIMGKHPKCIYFSLCFELIYFQRLCLYLYYLFRAYDTFKGTVHKFKQRNIELVAFCICFVWIGGQIFYFVWNSVVYSCTEFSVMVGIIPLGVTESCVSTLCVAIFVFKLNKVYSKTKSSTNEAGNKLKYLVTKLTILSAATIVTTILVLGFWPFTFALGLMGIDTPINVICLVLSFGFYDKYFRVLCHPCRWCFERKLNKVQIDDE